MSLLAKIKRPGPVPPSELHGHNLALYNILAYCYPQDILSKMHQTRKLHPSIYHELGHALSSAEGRSAHHLPALIRQLPRHVAATAVTALKSLGFAAPPGFGTKPVIFFDEERERLWEVVTRLLERNAVEPKQLQSLVEGGRISDNWDDIHALHKIRWQTEVDRAKDDGDDMTNPAYKWYHKQPLEDVQRFLAILQPVAKCYGYQPPLRVRGHA